MTIDEYIKTRYGVYRGAKADFLRDNPHILGQELSRWRDYNIHLETGEIYKSTSKKVLIIKNNPNLLPFKKLLEFIQSENVFDNYNFDENDLWKSEKFNTLIKEAEKQLIKLTGFCPNKKEVK